jgi:hypothetical protein
VIVDEVDIEGATSSNLKMTRQLPLTQTLQKPDNSPRKACRRKLGLFMSSMAAASSKAASMIEIRRT